MTTLETSKMIKLSLKYLKWPKYPSNLLNDKNKWTSKINHVNNKLKVNPTRF